MHLPVLLPELKSQRFACHSCTNCCRELVVHLTSADIKKIDEQDWSARLGAPSYIRLGRDHVLAHKPTGGCVFLMDDQRCRIHAEYGLTAKPLACQLYPFTLNREDDDLRASIRFDCPSAAANKGEPIAQHRGEVRRLAAELQDVREAIFIKADPVKLRHDCQISAAQLDAFLQGLDAWLRNDDRPLDDRLLDLCSLCDTLDAAKLDSLTGEQIGELMALLMGELGSTPTATHLPPPTDRHHSLLRMTVFAHCEHVTLAQMQAPLFARWRYRWSQLARGRQMIHGKAHVPALVADAREIPFDSVEAVLRDPETAQKDGDELLTRYLRMRLLSHSAFGPAYYNWPVIDGLRAWVLSIAAARWLARYFAVIAYRCTWRLPDLHRAIGVIDRAAGRAKELGRASAALRVRYFANDHGLARLILHDPDRAERVVSPTTTAG